MHDVMLLYRALLVLVLFADALVAVAVDQILQPRFIGHEGWPSHAFHMAPGVGVDQIVREGDERFFDRMTGLCRAFHEPATHFSRQFSATSRGSVSRMYERKACPCPNPLYLPSSSLTTRLLTRSHFVPISIRMRLDCELYLMCRCERFVS